MYQPKASETGKEKTMNITNPTITAAMETAKMDAVMVAREISDYDNPQAVAALKAAGNAGGGNAMADHKARALAVAWINGNEAAALDIINARIARRAAKAAQPVIAAVARGLRGED
jgi:shikimate 5-dehydrogenase